MRDGFIKSVTRLLETRDDVILLTADLGFGIFDDIRARFADRFINVGVAEQNMIGIATGLGLEGWTVFAYSIGNFSTLRCLEQIRNDAAYHEVNVNIITSGGGFTYGALGMSHHATEDISIMRALPRVDVIVPCDAYESEMAVLAMVERQNVSYLRIEKNVDHDTREAGGEFEIGKWRTIVDGEDITFVASGGIVEEALKAADEFRQLGKHPRVVSAHTLTPGDVEGLHKIIDTSKVILSIEENTVTGGVGGFVAETIAEYGKPVRFKRIGMPGVYSSVVGDQKYLRDHYKLNAAEIVSVTRDLLAKTGS